MRSIYLMAALSLGAPTAAFATPAITVASTSGATNLPLDGTGLSSPHIVKVAVLDLFTDAAGGLTASISSGSLSRAGGAPVAFQVAVVDHDAAEPSAAAFTAASGDLYACSLGATTVTVQKDLYIKYRPADLQVAGRYTASLQIDVYDN